jgi:hypothetical protein
MSSTQPKDEMFALQSKIAALEIKQKMQRRAQKQKTELMKIQTLFENEKRDRQIENERRDRQAEKKDLEQKMVLALENEKRKRKVENERRDRQAEKKDLEQKMELIKIQAAMENEKRDRMLEQKEAQHQIEQLKWEVRLGQMEQQQLVSQPTYSRQPIVTSPAPHILYPNPPLPVQRDQGETEQRLLQQLLELKLQEKEKGQPHPLPPAHTVQPAPQESMATLAARPSAHLQDQDPTTTTSEENMHTTTDLTALSSAHPQEPTTTSSKNDAGTKTKTDFTALPSVRQSSTGSIAPPAGRPQASNGPKQEPHQRRQPITAQSASNPPSKTVQPQQQHAGPITKGGSVPLPDNAHTHFFLSHCQATGGDQTNAIYLELRQMGFSCW